MNITKEINEFEKGKEKRRFTYDKEGSIIKEERNKGEREYEYDAEKKLVRLKREDGREERYGYDGEGKRVAQEGRGRNRRYCYYGNKVLWEEREGGERKRSYVLGYGIEGVEEEGKRYYYQKDERESTKYISDEEGEIRNRYEYDGYGRLEEKEEELAPIFLYTGQEYDEELEGYWLGERIYREEYGRFLKEDEYEGDGLNLYTYCRNNPIVYYDPTGYAANENGKHETPQGEESGTVTPRYADEPRISKELYDKLRGKTPSVKIKKDINKDIDSFIGTRDEALGLEITEKLEADHIVPMKKITCMEGFDTLSFDDQLRILNNPENFIGLTKTANTSKGSKSYSEWVLYQKENISVNAEFKARMIQEEKRLEGILQKQIDDLNNAKNTD